MSTCTEKVSVPTDMANKILTVSLCLSVILTGCHSLDKPVTVTGNCSSHFYELDVWGVERDPLTCRMYDTNSCSNGELPPQVNGVFMGSPESMHIEGLLVEASGTLAPQLVVTWKPPRQAAGFENLKGFYMEIYKITGQVGKTFTCRVFDFSQNNFTSDDYQLTFRKKLVGFPGGDDHVYRLELFTLPMDADSVSRKQFFSLQRNQGVSDVNDTANWAAAVSYYIENATAPATITFDFSLAPSWFGFKQYEIMLVNKEDDRNAEIDCYLDTERPYDCQGTTHNNPPPDATTVSHSFYDVQAGNYTIWISPRDPYWQESNCLCHHGYFENNGEMERECARCLTTTTQMFTVDGVRSTTPSNPIPSTHPAVGPTSKPTDGVVKTTEKAETPVSEPVYTGNDGNMQTIIIVVAVVVVLIVGVLVAIVFYGKRRRHCYQGFQLPFLQKPINGHLAPQTLSKKSVYLLYANDHQDHLNVVAKFAKFLNERCNCEVYFLPWYQAEVRATGAGNWIFSHIDKADHVIIINSEAAFQLYNVRNMDVSFHADDEGPEGDTFSTAITHVMTKSGHADFYKKTILAYFDYTPEECVLKDISPGVQYRLPKHLKELLYHVHEIDSNGINTRQLEIQAMNLDNQEGIDLNEAITKAKHYQKSNKEWFSQRFHRQDSAYDSISYTDEPDNPDSVSVGLVSPDTPTGQAPFYHEGNGDDVHSAVTYATNPAVTDGQSAFTYNTDYLARNRPPRFSPVPPSDVDTLATEDIEKKLMQINQESMQNPLYRMRLAENPEYSRSFPDEGYPMSRNTYANSGFIDIDMDCFQTPEEHRKDAMTTCNTTSSDENEDEEDLEGGRDV